MQKDEQDRQGKNEKDRRALIKELLRNNSIDARVKQHQIARVQLGKPIDFSDVPKEHKVSTVPECTHYVQKKCHLFHFTCCDSYEHCHRCHREQHPLCTASEPQIDTVQCKHCRLRQPPSNQCVECTQRFAQSYCSICKIWTEKEIYHCEKCRICRVGNKADLFHCDTCQACFPVAGRDLHKCSKRSLVDATCSFCFERLHDSQIPVIALKCEHLVHEQCARSALRKHHFSCPMCRKAMVDMGRVWTDMDMQIQAQPMPEAYRRQLTVKCFDCQSSSLTDYHFIGNKCLECGGYNTAPA